MTHKMLGTQLAHPFSEGNETHPCAKYTDTLTHKIKIMQKNKMWHTPHKFQSTFQHLTGK